MPDESAMPIQEIFLANFTSNEKGELVYMFPVELESQPSFEYSFSTSKSFFEIKGSKT